MELAAWGSRRIIWIEANRIDESLRAAATLGADGIGVNTRAAFRGGDLDFLARLTDLQGLVIPFASDVDLAEIRRHSSLRFLSLGATTAAVDLNAFPRLEELRLDAAPGQQFSSLSRLEVLAVGGYRPPSRCLSDLPIYPMLRDLELVSPTIDSLDGVERQPALRRLSVHHARRLASIRAILATRLEFVHLDQCKAIADIEGVANLATLTSLRYTNGAELPSLGFLQQFPALKEFRFTGTTIRDGDMSPLVSLDVVGFMPRRDYSHTPAEIEAAIQKRRRSA